MADEHAAARESARRRDVELLAKHARHKSPADIITTSKDHSQRQGAAHLQRYQRAAYLSLVCASLPRAAKKARADEAGNAVPRGGPGEAKAAGEGGDIGEGAGAGAVAARAVPGAAAAAAAPTVTQCKYKITASFKPGKDHMGVAVAPWRIATSVLEHTCTPGAKHKRNVGNISAQQLGVEALNFIDVHRRAQEGVAFMKHMKAKGKIVSKDVA